MGVALLSLTPFPTSAALGHSCGGASRGAPEFLRRIHTAATTATTATTAAGAAAAAAAAAAKTAAE